MPASLPGSTASSNRTANPSAGRAIAFNALSGPKGSLLDKDTAGNASTGALSTGIGIDTLHVIRPNPRTWPATSPQAILDAGLADNVIGGHVAALSTYMFIGGGKSTANVNGKAPNVPYTVGFDICHAGNGAARDAVDGSSNPTGVGFPAKMVTAAGAVANAGVVETGFKNYSNVALASGDSVFGISTTENVAPA